MTTRRLPTRHRQLAVIGGAVGAMALVSTFVLQASSAVFTAQTDNLDNSFVTSDVELSDNDSGTALFTVSDMNQSDVETRCIEVSYTGTTDPQPVALFSGGYADSSTLGQYLNLDVSLGNAGTTCAAFAGTNIFSGTLVGFDGAHTDYSNGVTGWDPAAASTAAPETRAYQFSVELDAATPNSFSGESVSGLTFTWEVQS